MTFNDSLKLESLCSPCLDSYYRTVFRENLVGVLNVSQMSDFQHMGIDKFLALKVQNLPRLFLFSIDEKVRGQRWPDYAAEVWSKREKEVPGWVWTSRADYIVYAFFNMETKQLMDTPRFIPTLDFVMAIKIGDYPIIEAKNLGWTTVCKTIPEDHLESKEPRPHSLADFMIRS